MKSAAVAQLLLDEHLEKDKAVNKALKCAKANSEIALIAVGGMTKFLQELLALRRKARRS